MRNAPVWSSCSVVLPEMATTILRCFAVASGEEAMEALEVGTFDAIVLDLTLPGMSGVELLQQIKSDARWMNIPGGYLYRTTTFKRRRKSYQASRGVDYYQRHWLGG